MSRFRRGGGFSILEILAVMAVLSIVLAFALPAFTNLSRGTTLTRAGQELTDALMLGRQEALARNRKATVRLIRLAGIDGSAPRFRALQVWVVTDDGGTMEPLGKVVRFPEGIVFAESPSLSPLLQSPPAQTGKMEVAGVTCEFAAFAIAADGSLASSISNQNSYLTLVQEKDLAASTPVNFYSVFINPITGGVSSFRP